MPEPAQPLRVAVLVKQIPRFEEMRLGADGRLEREGLEAEMNPYCRRAVTAGVASARDTGGSCTVFTLGPPEAEDVLREAIAWGATDGVLITDRAFAGSDTLATARALAAALRREGPFDLVLAGRNSVDADTGQVGPQVAEMLDMAFVGGARALEIEDGVVRATLEHDDGWARVEADLPALVSCAERLCEPCKVDPAGRADVRSQLIRRLTAADLGPGPWGQAGSPTHVGEVRLHDHGRARRRLSGPLDRQIDEAVALLADRGVWPPAEGRGDTADREVPVTGSPIESSPVVTLLEPARKRVARELLGIAAELAHATDRSVVGLVPEPTADLGLLGGWGADHVILIDRTTAPDDLATAIADWCRQIVPWAMMVPSTMWGRELAGRLAARLGVGLTGDAVDLEVLDDRLIAWKPAFGGQLVAAITSTSAIQMVTIRPGVLPVSRPRRSAPASVETLEAPRRQRVRIEANGRDDEVETLATARVVVGVGVGVDHTRYAELDDLLATIGGTLAATRKVTDQGWLPRARQVGITGRSIAPDLYIAIGMSGRFNHVIGFRAAGTVLAVNEDADAAIFDACDIGIVGDWAEVVPRLTDSLSAVSGASARSGATG